MGDVRYEPAYARIARSSDRAKVLTEFDDAEVIQALGAASREKDALLANILATEAMNRMRRAGAIARHQGEGALAGDAEGRCTFANRAATIALSRGRSELIGAALSDVLKVRTREGTPPPGPEPVGRVLAAGETLRYDDLFLKAADRRAVPVIITYAPVVVDDEPTGIVVTFRDITGVRAQEQELAEANRFLQATLDALPLSIAILDDSAKIVAVNAAWRSFGERNGLSWADHGVGHDYVGACATAVGEEGVQAGEFADGIRSVLASERSFFEMEYPCDSPGESRWFVGRVTRLAWDGPPHLVISHVDITSRKVGELRLRAALDARAGESR